jgi:hypothetical protein
MKHDIWNPFVFIHKHVLSIYINVLTGMLISLIRSIGINIFLYSSIYIDMTLSWIIPWSYIARFSLMRPRTLLLR